MNEPSTTRSLQCESCGHALTVAELRPDASCPFCGHRQSEPGLLEELRAYHQSVQARLGAAEEHRERAADWTEMAKETGSQRSGVDMVVVIGLPLALAFVAVALFKLGVLSGRTQGTLTTVGGNIAVVAAIVWLLVHRRRSTASRPALDAQIVACPSCGAPGRLAAGEETATCKYCGAALVPSRATMARGIEVAIDAERRAAIEQVRAERAAFVKALGGTSSLSTSGGFIAMGLFGTMCFVYAVAMTVGGMLGSQTFFLWGVGIALLAIPATFAHYRLARRADWRAAVTALARQFGGRVLSGLADRVAWLNHYWPERVQFIFESFSDAATAGETAGFPVMLIFDPFPYAQGYAARIEIFVAATGAQPSGAGVSGPPALDPRVAQALAARGFSLAVTESGYWARASDAVLKALRRAPSGARQLATVVTTLGDAAAAAGARPAVAIP